MAKIDWHGSRKINLFVVELRVETGNHVLAGTNKSVGSQGFFFLFNINFINKVFSL
jgi:hypothetical protein